MRTESELFDIFFQKKVVDANEELHSIGESILLVLSIRLRPGYFCMVDYCCARCGRHTAPLFLVPALPAPPPTLPSGRPLVPHAPSHTRLQLFCSTSLSQPTSSPCRLFVSLHSVFEPRPPAFSTSLMISALPIHHSPCLRTRLPCFRTVGSSRLP